MRRENFYKCPGNEAQAIAKHYTAHAIITLQLLELLKAKEAVSDGAADKLDVAIQHHVKEIKRNHLFDFGIQLEWHQNAEKG